MLDVRLGTLTGEATEPGAKARCAGAASAGGVDGGGGGVGSRPSATRAAHSGSPASAAADAGASRRCLRAQVGPVASGGCSCGAEVKCSSATAGSRSRSSTGSPGRGTHHSGRLSTAGRPGSEHAGSSTTLQRLKALVPEGRSMRPRLWRRFSARRRRPRSASSIPSGRRRRSATSCSSPARSSPRSSCSAAGEAF